MLEPAFGHAWLNRLLTHLLSYDSYIVLLSWFSAIAGAALSYVLCRDLQSKRGIRHFLQYCFPAAILRSQSCRLDLFFVLSLRFAKPILITPVLVTSAAVTQLTSDGLTGWFGVRQALPNSLMMHVIALTVAVVIADCCNFCVHYMDHKVRVLWEFHKVHHAAEFLIPITNRRVHPVQELFDDTGLLLGVGVWLGAFSYLAGEPIKDSVLLGMDAYFLANLLSFYHLRHSHIAMSYGWLENILLSPAQHQLHHSCNPRHWDKNFGLLLSCWDRMAGTFVRSESEDVVLGLPKQYSGQYDSLAQLYLRPFAGTLRLATQAFRAPKSGTPAE